MSSGSVPTSSPGCIPSVTMVWVMLRATVSAPLPRPDWARTTESGRSWRVERRRRKKSASAFRCLRMRLRASPPSPAMSASAIMAWACVVSLAMRAPEALPVRRVQLRDPVEDVDEELEAGIAADRGHQCMELAGVTLGVDRNALGEVPQLGQVVLVGPLGRQLAGDLLEDDAGLEDLVETGVDPVQIQHHRVDDRPHRRLGDDEAATGATAGPGDLLVLHQAHGLTEHGPAHLVALE